MTTSLGVALRELTGACPLHVVMRQKTTAPVPARDPQTGQQVEIPMEVPIQFRALAFREVGEKGSDVWEFRTSEKDKNGQDIFLLIYFTGADIASVRCMPKVV